MKNETSPPSCEVFATCPYLGPDQSSPWSLLIFWRSVLIVSFLLCLGLPSCLFCSGFFNDSPYASVLHTCYMPRSSNSSLITLIKFGEEYRSWDWLFKLKSPVTSSLFGSNLFLSTLFSKTFGLYSSVNFKDQVSHPYIIRQNCNSIYFNLCSFGCKLKDERFWKQRYDSVQNLLSSGCQITIAVWLICCFILTKTSNTLMQESNRARPRIRTGRFIPPKRTFSKKKRYRKKHWLWLGKDKSLGADIDKYLHPLYLSRVPWRRTRGVEINVRLFLPSVLSRIVSPFWELLRFYPRGNGHGMRWILWSLASV